MNDRNKIFQANYHVGSLRVYFDYIFDAYIDNPTLADYVDEHITGLEELIDVHEVVDVIYEPEYADEYMDEINSLVNDRGL